MKNYKPAKIMCRPRGRKMKQFCDICNKEAYCDYFPDKPNFICEKCQEEEK